MDGDEWVLCALARMGDGDAALKYIDDYLRGFILEKGFHANDDREDEY